MRRLYLRTCNSDYTSYRGFRWPSEVGAEVEAPDWSPGAHCGGGLHGLLWGEGNANLLSFGSAAVWIVFSSDDDPVYLRGKCKVKSARVEHIGDRDSAISYLLANGAADKAVVFARKTGGYGSTLTGGDGSTLTGGDYSTLTGGDYSKLTGGDYSTLTGGDRSTLCWRVFDGSRYRIHTRYVGEDGIKLDTPYIFEDGEVVEVK